MIYIQKACWRFFLNSLYFAYLLFGISPFLEWWIQLTPPASLTVNLYMATLSLSAALSQTDFFQIYVSWDPTPENFFELIFPAKNPFKWGPLLNTMQ